MGTVTVTRQAPAMSEAQLHDWYREQLSKMAFHGGADGYCGNWNANDGLYVTAQPPGKVLTYDEAYRLLESRVVKRGSVLAVRVGDFSKAFPATAADKDLVSRLQESEKSLRYFDLSILERAQKAKSKTKRCPKCESSINVHALKRPSTKEFDALSSAADIPGIARFGSRVYLVHMHELTACPVCGAELLKTETDKKAQDALGKRVCDLRTRVAAAKTAHDSKALGKEQPHWLLMGDSPE